MSSWICERCKREATVSVLCHSCHRLVCLECIVFRDGKQICLDCEEGNKNDMGGAKV